MVPWRKLTLTLLVLLGLLLPAGCARQDEDPQQVDDRAGLLSGAEQQQLEALQGRLLKEIDVHLQLVILDQPAADLDALAHEMFEEFGQKSLVHGARGVLLLIDPEAGAVRMEIGYDLEGIFPDAFIGYIEKQQMAPFFAAGRVADGVAATVELLVGQAFGSGDPPVASVRTPLRHAGGGAGARSPAPIGVGLPTPTAAFPPELFHPQATPLATLDRYRTVLRQHLKDPELPLYTQETRQFLRRWLVTDAQQENELRALDAGWSDATVVVNGPLAVVRFPVEARTTPPYFFKFGGGMWQLDLAAAGRLVGFNHRNQWYFHNLDHGYMFAFGDWRFDAGGLPHWEEKR